MSHERRVHARLEVVSQLRGQIVSLTASLIVRDISAGGFSVESATPFPLGAEYLFCFTTADDVVLVDAAVVYSRRSTRSDGGGGFTSGFAFLHASRQDTHRAIQALLNAVTTSLRTA